MEHYNLLVIGGDGAGMGAASQARRMKKDISIAVFEMGEFVSYAACGMPYYIAGDVKDYNELIAINVNEFIEKRNIHIKINHRVTSVDFEAKSVTVTHNGKTQEYTYDKLVIATGASALLPPIKGIETPATFVLRTLRHGLDIKEAVNTGKVKKVILVGGGFISIELAESFLKKNIEVVLLEKEETVASLFSPEIRQMVMDKFAEKNIKIVTGVNINEISYDGSNVTAISDKGNFEGQMLIVSTGVRPSTEFLKDTDLAMIANGAIIIDDKSMTNIPDVFAAGDCATVTNLITGEPDYIPMATTANKQGRVAGLQVAGVTAESFKGALGSQFLRVCDLQVGKTGFNSRDAEKHGINTYDGTIEWRSKPGYCPGNTMVKVKLTVNADTGVIIGGEIGGFDGAVLRINTLATAITSKMKLEDLAYLDTGYAPPFSTVWDPVVAAAQSLLKREITN